MSQGVNGTRAQSRSEAIEESAAVSSAQVELRHFQNVTNSVVQDALSVWADLWAELDSQDGRQKTEDGEQKAQDGTVLPDPSSVLCPRSSGSWSPTCGWPQFLEKMWILRQNLDFLARFSRQRGSE